MTSLCKSLAMEDYIEIQEHVKNLEHLITLFDKNGGRVPIVHTHKFWEWASALHAVTSMYDVSVGDITVLDVCPGSSILGPAMSYLYGTTVHEQDPDVTSNLYRSKLNFVLKQLKKKPVKRELMDVSRLDLLGQYDAVFCLSVLEHLNPKAEEKAWERIANRVKTGGLLFITVTMVNDDRRPHVNDHRRQTCYTLKLIEKRIEHLEGLGYTPLGTPDYSYHGDYVHDYSLYRIGMVNSTCGSMDRLMEDTHNSKLQEQGYETGVGH